MSKILETFKELKDMDLSLCYLWIHGDKNIHKMGFNFSSDVVCSYSEPDNTFSANKIEDKTSLLFSDNFLGVKSIVGENGSGKTTLLNHIYKTLFILFFSQRKSTHSILVLSSILPRVQDPHLYVFSNKEINIRQESNVKVVLVNDRSFPKEFLSVIYYSNLADYDATYNWPDNYHTYLHDISTTNIQERMFGRLLHQLQDLSYTYMGSYHYYVNSFDVVNQLLFIRNNRKILSDTGISLPAKLSINPSSFTMHSIAKYIFAQDPNAYNQEIDEVKEKFFSVANLIFSQATLLTTVPILQFTCQVFWCLLLFYLYFHKQEIPDKKTSVLKMLNQFLNSLVVAIPDLNTFDATKPNEEILSRALKVIRIRVIEFFSNVVSRPEETNTQQDEFSSNALNFINGFEEFISHLYDAGTHAFNFMPIDTQVSRDHQLNNSLNFHLVWDLELTSKEIFDLLVDKLISPFSTITGELIASFVSFSWRSQSTGEKAMLDLFSRIHSIEKKSNKNIILLIDEGESYFHPQWQKMYFSLLHDILPKILSNKNIQLIFTSHSPFSLSDLPVQNVILLSKNEHGNAQVVNPELLGLKTFGGNLHTLFTKSFFLRDGLIGEFSKKIINNKVIDVVNNLAASQDDIKTAYGIVALIGEPILQRKLTLMLDERFEIALDVDERIRLLEENLNVLRGMKRDQDQ